MVHRTNFIPKHQKDLATGCTIPDLEVFGYRDIVWVRMRVPCQVMFGNSDNDVAKPKLCGVPA